MLLFCLFANGVYDILCSTSILYDFSLLSQLHLKMFDYLTLLEKRLLAYWILTNGCVRLSASIFPNKDVLLVAAATYFTEAFCFEYECEVGKAMFANKVRFVSITSVIFGLLLISSSLEKVFINLANYFYKIYISRIYKTFL